MTKTKYYALFNCDQWKSRDSHRFVGTFTKRKLIELIKQRIEADSYEFGGKVSEIDYMTIQVINSLLTYASIQELSIDEVLD